jgi:deoxyribonuclease-1
MIKYKKGSYMKILILLAFITLNVDASEFSMATKMIKKLFRGSTSHSSKEREKLYDNNSQFLEIQNPSNGNHGIKDFSMAKKVLKKTHYLHQTKTLYCNCTMTAWNKFSGEGCSYKHEKYEKQWDNIEAEHLVPFSQILSGTKAYMEGEPSICGGSKGRKCADKVYGFLAGDLWILGPSELELNRVHSNYQWAELGNNGKQYGSCDFYYEDQKVQPPKHLKGKIARAYKYIQDVYKVKVISGKNEKLFEIWANYPPTEDQCKLAKEIIKEQGNENKFEVDACKKNGMW